MAGCLSMMIIYGCASAKPDPTALKALKQVAVVSLTLDKVGTGGSNEAILYRAVNYADSVYQRGLLSIPDWQLVKAPDLAGLANQFSDLSTSKAASEVMLRLADEKKIGGELNPDLFRELLKASFTGDQQRIEELKGDVLAYTLKVAQQELDRMRSRLVWPEGKVGIPYWLARGVDQAPETEMILQEVTKAILEDYRQKHNLDGVIIVHLASQVGSPGDIRVIVKDNRVLSSLKVNPALAIRGQGGKLILVEGSTRLDDLAPMKLAMPIFAGTMNSKNRIENLQLDLADPGESAIKGYMSLIDKTAGDLMADIKKTMTN